MIKKVFIFFILMISVLSLAAQDKELTLKNGVKIINSSLLSIIKKRVIPNILEKNEGIYIHCINDKDKYTICINIILLDEIRESTWNEIDGFTLINDHIIIFNNCDKLSIFCKKKNPVSITVIPFTDFVPSIADLPHWEYEFNKGKFTLIKEILAY